MRGCWSREAPGAEAGKTGSGRTEERAATTGAEVAEAEAGAETGEREGTGRTEEAIFVAVAKAEVTTGTDKCHLELPKPTAKPGTSQSIMIDFAVKTRNFYK